MTLDEVVPHPQHRMTHIRTISAPLLAATLFAHESAGFDVHVPAGLGGDVLGLGRARARLGSRRAGGRASARPGPAW